jgi:glycosyltransferase involved in cell wall biosynthesis
MSTVPAPDDPHRDGLASASGLRIALFTGNYNYVREGANNALNRLVGHLLDRGAEVRVYSPTSRTPAFEPVGDLISVPSVPLPVRSEFRLALGLALHVRRDVEAFDPNVVHVATPDLLGSAAQRFARRKGVPVVASFHTMFEAYLDYYGLGMLGSWAWRRQKSYYQRAELVLVPSAAMRSHIARMGGVAGSIRRSSPPP